MKKILAVMVVLFTMLTGFTAYGDDNRVTSYAFADIAGVVHEDTITVNVPYKTVCTYWNHKVSVSEGAYFSTGAITQIDDKHYEGELTVTSASGASRVYTVKINKNSFVAPTYEIGKATSIRKNAAKFHVKVVENDAPVNSVRIVYYTKKNNLNSYSINRSSGTNVDDTFEVTGLAENTKYYYYLSVQTNDKTYETGSKSFTTKQASDTTTSSSSSSNSAVTTQPSKGTNATGPATAAREDNTARNEWKLVDGKWLYFGADGFSKVGWFQVGDKWYYTVKGTNELVMSGWRKINDVWYYFDASGAMIANNWVNYGNDWYWMGESGSMLTNQEFEQSGKKYLIGPDGVVFSDKMIMKDGKWMYYKPGATGLAVDEDFNYNGFTYHADKEGFIQ